MNGRIFIAPVGAVDDENRWLEIGMLTEDGIALAEQDEVDVLSWGQLEPIRTDRPGMPASSPDPVDPLDLIDRAVAGLCPCGAAPSEQFYPYCSYDCKPNHIGGDSDTSPAGQPLATPMRWRPDLVTAADEREMTPFTHRAMNAGLGHQVWLYPDGERVQLRVDDGYRFIGADLPLAVYQDAEQAPERARKWQALRRQLLNEDDLVHTGAAHAELLALAARAGGSAPARRAGRRVDLPDLRRLPQWLDRCDPPRLDGVSRAARGRGAGRAGRLATRAAAAPGTQHRTAAGPARASAYRPAAFPLNNAALLRSAMFAGNPQKNICTNR